MFYDPFVAMEHVYNEIKTPTDPAYADLDYDTKSALLDLAISSPEAQKVAETRLDPADFNL
ncbi:hypothetical protein DFR67_1163 [Williamsia limnetica]|uniref:Uncharacterized protein n=1 Tax=Williamsia limnetica TaxID=882452 RepID=A0A318RV60_WILLI|nr:hypothetical protein [Williamsia limnetica]PYE13449.1 hypothetical protein DFR67_1163 [Williamsia limnetica]